MNERIFLSPPHMGGTEQNFIKEAFDANWISPAGPHLNAFENELSSYLGGSHVAALSSGTAAIHLALIMAGVQQGDEVICSTFTFSGSCNPILYQGATPVFVDSEPDTWNMDPVLLEEAIQHRITTVGRRPKAIILVHLYGMPAKIDDILSLARKYEIPVIEDAAEALGSRYRGVLVGTFGDIGIFSFNGNKIITTSGGGAIVSSDEAKITKARFLATQARDPAPHYEHSEIGYNYRLSNVSAGIGRGQLQVLQDRINQRRSVFDYYQSNLTGPKISFVLEPDGYFSNRWLSTIKFTDGERNVDKIRIALEAENIESRPLWKPMHLQPVFKTSPTYENGTSEKLFRTGLCLPSGSSLEKEQQDKVIEIMLRNI